MAVGTYRSPTKNYSDEEWTATLTAMSAKLGVKLPAPDLAADLLAQQYVTDFLQANTDDLRSLSSQLDVSGAKSLAFDYQHVEPLLKEAGRLLDRALATDQEHFRLRVEQFNLALELCQFFALDLINQAEIDAGIYSLPSVDADADFTVIDQSSEANTKIATLFADPAVLKCLSPDVPDTLVKAAHDGAFNNSAPDLNPGYSNGGGGQLEPPVGHGTLRDYITLAAVTQVELTTPLQQALSQAEVRKQQLQADNTEARRISIEAKKKFYSLDASTFKLQRRAVAFGIMQTKWKASAEANGPLDYKDRLSALLERQTEDLMAAFGRMLAINRGLKLIYNIDPGVFPSEAPVRLDECVNWLRGVDNALAHRSKLDQRYVCRISVANLSGKHFSKGLDTGIWTFRVPRSRFGGQSLVRIRGVALYSVDRDGESFYDVDVTIPGKDAEFIYNGPTPAAPPQAPENNISPCWFRGVGSRRTIHRPEVSGQDALYNCSPIGTWTIQLVGDSPAAAKKNNLTDLQLDVYLAVQKLTPL